MGFVKSRDNCAQRLLMKRGRKGAPARSPGKIVLSVVNLGFEELPPLGSKDQRLSRPITRIHHAVCHGPYNKKSYSQAIHEVGLQHSIPIDQWQAQILQIVQTLV